MASTFQIPQKPRQVIRHERQPENDRPRISLPDEFKPCLLPLHSLPFTSRCLTGEFFFSDYNFTLGPERTGIVGRNGVGKSSLLKLVSGVLKPTAGAVSVTGTFGVLHQSPTPSPDETIGDLFGVDGALATLARIEAGRGSEADFAEADWTLEGRLAEALMRAGLGGAGAQTRLAQLSGGQRTRAGLAALIFGKPDFLLLDEPTNNLDREGREDVARLLAEWRGGAVVVSHDRELLETMEAILELTQPGASRYGGGWSAYEARKAQELAGVEQELAQAERRISEIGNKAQRAIESKARRDGAGSRNAAKGGAPRIVLGAQKSRAQASAGAVHRMAAKQKGEAEAVAEAARGKVEVLQPFSVTLAPTGLVAGRAVLSAERLSVGYAPDDAVTAAISFDISGPERVAITGTNGSGKSTLLKTLAGRLPPLAGSAKVHVPMVYLDQEVSLLGADQTILQCFSGFNPEADENACRSALARFRFRSDAALQNVSTLSGGERLRAGLACVLGGPVPAQLLLLDELTNHLDIESLEAVEAGLRAYDGAFLVVSHDERFLEKVGITSRIGL